MRAYFFGNMYLSSIQQGIQAAHVVADMFIKYELTLLEPSAIDKGILLRKWASEHKTMILLNAGYSESIHQLVNFFDDRQNPFPWVEFHEGEDALDGALTSVGIVISEKIYNTSAWLRSLNYHNKMEALTRIADSGSLSIPKELYEGGEVTTWEFNKWEYKLIQKLNEFGMAK